MDVRIQPGKIHGTFNAPASKSFTHRALICAALADGKSMISNFLKSEDTDITISALRKLGVDIRVNNTTATIRGTGEIFHLPRPYVELNVGNSGTTLRLLTALCSLTDGEVIITGSERLQERPIGELIRSLQQLGIHAETMGKNNNYFPVKITGGTMTGGTITINAKDTSQYVSALLLIAPFTQQPLIMKVVNLPSSPYIEITIDLMKRFGVQVRRDQNIFLIPNTQKYKSTEYSVEGDYSAASYFFAASAITNSKINLKNLNPHSVQGDRFFIEILNRLSEKNKILHGIKIDMHDYPDLVPTLAVVAAFAKGKTVINNIAHLRLKESDRISTIATELAKMGIQTIEKQDELTIIGNHPKGAIIETHNDHRIAMSFAVAALAASSETVIKNAEVVHKSYPNFWKDLQSIGAQVTVIN